MVDTLPCPASALFLSSVFPGNSIRIIEMLLVSPAGQPNAILGRLNNNGLGDRVSPIRFGIFEVDLVSRELRRHGMRVKLQDQPFQVLVALIRNPHEVVTREELQKRLWPPGIVVDFDSGLNKAINRLREALGDDLSLIHI